MLYKRNQKKYPYSASISLADWLRKILLSWLVAVTLEYLSLPEPLRGLSGLEGLARMSLGRVLAMTGIGAGILWGVSCVVRTNAAERWGLVGVFGLLSTISLASSFSWEFLLICLLVLAVLVVYGIRGWQGEAEPLSAVGKRSTAGKRSMVGKRIAAGTKPAAISSKKDRICLRLTVGFAILFFVFLCAWTVGRVFCFAVPTFDFGIFSQMFYHMKESGLPLTTVERDGLLSHFKVHLSPIYYFLLPFYCLLPEPAVLQVLQAAVITSAVIPLWKLGKHYGLSGGQRMLLCLLLLLYPAFSGGVSYDLHENCFLTPLLLWLFYGLDRKHPGMVVLAAGLTLMVKEDAAVYVAVIALWQMAGALLRRQKDGSWNLRTGCLLLAAALGWFLLATGYLARSGDGVMTNRYRNFMFGGSSSLLTVIQSVILNPMKAIYECADREKMGFLAATLLTLGGLPLLTRRFERYILLIPYVLVNLMSDYSYQHNLFFQYTFGSAACLLYLTLRNLSEWKRGQWRSRGLALTVVISGVCFGVMVVPKGVSYPVRYIRSSEWYQEIRDTLSQIPEEASVTATTFYTTFLSQREILYDVGQSSREHMLETEYIVLERSDTASCLKYAVNGEEDGWESLTRLLEQNGYTVFAELENTLVIYHRNP